MRKFINGLAAVVVVIVLILVVVFILPIGCIDETGTTRVLRDQGYTDIYITGWRPFSGSKDDQFHTGFEATTPTGKKITGVVTSGIFKGHTIRFD